VFGSRQGLLTGILGSRGGQVARRAGEPGSARAGCRAPTTLGGAPVALL